MFLLSNIPTITYRPPISDLFANFLHNWNTLMPALVVLFGTLAGFFFLKLIKNNM